MNENVNARIQALEAELAGLKKELAEPKKEGRFRAEFKGEYKTIRLHKGRFKSIEQIDMRDIYDIPRYEYFNYFRPDTDEAYRMAEKINLLLAMTARVKELNGEWVADWGNDNKLKYGLSFNSKKYGIDAFDSYNAFVFGLSVQSKEHAEILLNEFKERIERWY